VSEANKKTFEKRIQGLIQHPDPDATKAWQIYAGELEQEGTCDAVDFCRVVCKELASLQKEFGPEIVERLYNEGKDFTFNPFELRGAAELLQKGLPMSKVVSMALEGLCEGDGPVPKKPKKHQKYKSER